MKGELKHRKLGALGLGEGREGEKEEGVVAYLTDF